MALHPSNLVTLMVLDPGHFHAALIQKTMFERVSPIVYVYAPEGPDVRAHLQLIERYNTRPDHPTHWQCQVYTAPDYLDTMWQQRPGNVVLIAGINSRKMTYIQAAVQAGLHVLGDKPLCVDTTGWNLLKQVVETAQHRGVLLSDIMTQRHDIVSNVFKELLNTPAVFGCLTPGTAEQPGIERASVHYLSKEVSGQPLRRPTWYFDVTQQGEGLVDVTTHMVDVIMWTGFPQQAFDYATDVNLLQASRWPTMLTREQFAHITGVHTFPESLQQMLDHEVLPYSCNGEMLYTLKGVHTKVRVEWHVEAPAGSGDTHAVVTRGSRSTLYIRQGAAQRYRPELYVEPAAGVAAAEVEHALQHTIASLQRHYPGVEMQRQQQQWHVQIPDSYRLGHEAHFSKVAEAFFHNVQQGTRPTWELPNLLTKYYLTTHALALAQAETP